MNEVNVALVVYGLLQLGSLALLPGRWKLAALPSLYALGPIFDYFRFGGRNFGDLAAGFIAFVGCVYLLLVWVVVGVAKLIRMNTSKDGSNSNAGKNVCMNDRKALRDPSAARRIAVGCGMGFFVAFAPWVGLFFWFGKQSPWTSWPLLLIGGSLLLSLLCFLYAFSGLLFFRCPNCKARLRRQALVAASKETRIDFVCPKCNIEWETLWRHGPGDLPRKQS